jgi:hypothetical protein
MKVYLLTVSFSLTPVIEVKEVEAIKVTGGRIYFSDRRWAARHSGHVWETMDACYDDEEEALASAGRFAAQLLLHTEEALAKAEELSQKYPTIEQTPCL